MGGELLRKRMNVGKVHGQGDDLLSNLLEFFTTALSFITTTECVVCGRNSYGRNVCEECRHVFDSEPAPLTHRLRNDEVFYFGLYEERLRDFILAYKYGKHPSLSNYFAIALRKVVEAHGVQFDVISHVPATKTAKSKRGFDHMKLIAHNLAKRMGKPVVGLLRTVRETDQLLSQDRREAVKGKFEVIHPKEDLSGKAVLFVDDVLTTGSTMEECLKLLRRTLASTRFVPVVIALAK